MLLRCLNNSRRYVTRIPSLHKIVTLMFYTARSSSESYWWHDRFQVALFFVCQPYNQKVFHRI